MLLIYLLKVYHPVTPLHYSGNFWWASTNYLATLAKMNEATTQKADAEFWLCQNNPIMYVMHSCNLDQYHNTYPREKYADKE